jgi:hypothetical protein
VGRLLEQPTPVVRYHLGIDLLEGVDIEVLIDNPLLPHRRRREAPVSTSLHLLKPPVELIEDKLELRGIHGARPRIDCL